MPTLHPHLFFNGKAEEAFTFYQSIFGGEAQMHRYKDTPGQTFPESHQNRLMHASLPVGKTTLLMGADWHDAAGPYTQGMGAAVYVDVDSREQADDIHRSLSVGGKVTMPLQETFWGSYFGMLVDKFGVSWMIGYNLQQ